MSALTDLFTSLASKIRNKLGTTSKYTPAQAIAAIDNVYNKGVTDTKKGNATDGDVKSGKTYTSTNGVNRTGTFAQQTLSAITPSTSSQTKTAGSGKYFTSVTVNAISPQRSTGTAASGSGRDSTGPYVYIPYGWWPNASSSRNYTRLTEAQAIAVARTQTKTTDATRTTHTVAPDSNYLLSSVTVNKFPDPTGTFTPTGPDLNKAQADMGATNNLRFVNTATCYAAGVEYCKTLNQHKYSRFSTHQEGGWTLIPLPFVPSGAFQVKITYDTGSYASGDIIEVRKTDIATTVYGPFPTSSFVGFNWLGGTDPGYLYILLANRSSNVAISVDILLSNN